MNQKSPSSNTAGKVVVGFFIAAIFLIGMAGLTYYTQKRLLDTMEELSEPNQKLIILNALQGDIVQITQLDHLVVEDEVETQDSSVVSIKEKLIQLADIAEDSLEKSTIQSIRTNLDTLIIGYINLYEVKSNLASRNFTQEALRKVELGIRRRATSEELKPIDKVNPKDYLYNQLEAQSASKQELLSPKISPKEDKEISYLRQLERQNSKTSAVPMAQNLDSVLYNIRGVINRIYREESSQRQKLAQMEADISVGQSNIIGTIQTLIGTLQERALEEAESKNESALEMTKEMTLFLFAIVGLAIFGAVFMVYSILKEIKITKKYQENLEVSRKKSEQLARSKQEFLANMSHEIRNPLHVIQGYQSVLEKSELNTTQQSNLRMIGFASDTLMEIVDEVLDFSKLEAGKLKLEDHPFDPEALFGSLQNFFELQATEKELDFEWNFDLPESKWLVGDQLRLKQIVNNLLSNAFKFTKEGFILVNVKWGEKLLTVEIEDTGIGMNPKVLENVFLEFDQADTSISRKYGGTGLGLAIVQRLVSLMHGEIKVESEEGKGTKMIITLPMLTTEPEMPIFSADEIEALDLTGLTILLIDDDKVGLRYLDTILSYFGASIVAYHGGVEFRDEFVAQHIDLAIVDIQMPEFSGFDVLKMLRRMDRYSDLYILAMTANVFLEEKDKMMENGFNDILFKPFQEQVLKESLGRIFPNHIIEKTTQQQLSTENGSDLFQLQDLAKFCMGDELLLQDIVKELIVETSKDLDSLKRAYKSEDFEQILEICHQLGSRLGQIKSPTGQLARKIENSLKLGKKKGIGVMLKQLNDEVQRLLKSLTQAVNSSNKIET